MITKVVMYAMSVEERYYVEVVRLGSLWWAEVQAGEHGDIELHGTPEQLKTLAEDILDGLRKLGYGGADTIKVESQGEAVQVPVEKPVDEGCGKDGDT